MGIKHLWTILSPFCDKKPIYELENKTVAVDLSCWVCEAQNITDYYVQPGMYLRNLYFRTSFLLLMNVRPVFVLEGATPELKFDTVASRNAVQFKGARPRKKPPGNDRDGKKAKGRSRFDFVLKRCEEMLNYMGLCCVRGKGEAEALCAYLNRKQLVDGCITQDSDCFAYGATTVYRNFSISKQGTFSADGGSVEVYNLDEITKATGLGRNKIVALALLCGCDYSDGISNVGKESALKFFETVADEEILERLKSWRIESEQYEDLERIVRDKSHCTACGHWGKLNTHQKNGCLKCKTSTGCNSSDFKSRKQEVSIRSKALVDDNFPDQELIDEFLQEKEQVTEIDVKWQSPDLDKFIAFATKYLQWEAVYSLEKFLPILTRWQILNYEKKTVIKPLKIKKIRKTKGVDSYEILWSEDVTSIDIEDTDREKLFSTIEPQVSVRSAYPDLVQEFESTKKPKKTKTKRHKELANVMANLSICEATASPPRKKPQKTIDSYYKSVLVKNFNKDICKRAVLDASRFGDEEDLDVSDIIDGLIDGPPLFAKQLENAGFVKRPIGASE